jgi:mRNA interferase RelE/StbE
MKIEITKSAKKDLSVLEQTDRERILKAIFNFREHPETADIRKLRGKPVRWRLRVGIFRIIFEMNHDENIIYVLRIRHRKEAYR